MRGARVVKVHTVLHFATLVEDLTVQRTAALRLEFANNHHVALASVVHALLLQTVLTHSRDHYCLDIVLTSKSVEASMKAPASNLAIAGLAERFGDHVPGIPPISSNGALSAISTSLSNFWPSHQLIPSMR